MRTVGLGVTGLGDVLALCGLKYGSKEALAMTKEIFRNLQIASYTASMELAQKKGMFPMCDPHKLNIDRRLPSDLIKKIRKHGLRNARLNSIAPTGTLSMVFGNNCSSGIEPIFQTEYKRDVKVGGQNEEHKQEIVFQDPAWERFKSDPDYCPDATEESFTTALDLDVKAHVKTLAAIASYVDAAVSKTINIPADYSYEQTADVFMECWSKGVKGCTIFRPNKIRQGILHTKDEKPKEPNEAPIFTVSSNEIPRGVIIQVDDNAVGRERHLMTGCGTLHFQAFYDPDTGNLLETYTSKGSAGGCLSNQVALSRMCSLVARAGVPAEVIADQLLSAPPCIAYNNRARDKHDTSKGLSCPAAMGHALLSMTGEIQEMVGSEDPNEILKDTVTVTVKPEAAAVTDTNDPMCPECGAPLRMEGGCNVCPSCGWSKCR